MKKVFTILALLAVSTFAVAQVSVTFRVDMNDEGASADGVFVVGDWMEEAAEITGGDWQEPGSNMEAQMTDDDGNGVYTLTVTLPAGDYQYKYANGTSWPNAEAGGGSDNYQADLSSCGGTDNGFGGYNRNFTVADVDLVLPGYLFNSCNESVLNTFAPTSTVEAVSIMPNPMTDVTTIQWESNEPHDVIVTDMNGKTVRMFVGAVNNVEIEKGNMTPGIYVVAVRNAKGEMAIQKLVVQ
jgi:hypothetical protein